MQYVSIYSIFHTKIHVRFQHLFELPDRVPFNLIVM